MKTLLKAIDSLYLGAFSYLVFLLGLAIALCVDSCDKTKISQEV